MGDFYELFFEDAQRAATVLGIALTQRGTHQGEPIPLCGVPLHVVDHYLSKLVRAGYKVALCDQLEQPKPGKVVERGVTQVLTPGTLTDSKLLDDKSASYLAVFFPTSERLTRDGLTNENSTSESSASESSAGESSAGESSASESSLKQASWTLLFAELLTGHLFVTTAQTSTTILEAELQRFMPDEILVPQTKLGEPFSILFKGQGYAVSCEPFASDDAVLTWFAQQFPQASCSPMQSNSLKGALTLLYTYLKRNNERGLLQLKHLSFYRSEDYLMLDAATQRNLELVKNAHDGSSASTLFSVLDRAVTAMGSRMIKKWILRPLVKKEPIEERLQAIETFVHDHGFKNALRKLLQSVGDLERIVGRIALRRAQLYDYTALLKAVYSIPPIKNMLIQKGTSLQGEPLQGGALQGTPVQAVALLSVIASKIQNVSSLEELLGAALNDDTNKDWLIKQGYDTELDRIRKLVEQGAQAILSLEAEEQKKTGINSLKIRYNQVHGYGIEITTANLSLVPAHYIRTQTLANRERFTTQALKNLEHDLQKARTEIAHKEKEVFERVKAYVEETVPALKKIAHALAYVDALASLAETAYVQRYVRPTFNESHEIAILNGRHPVMEIRLRSQFIPNSVDLQDESSLWLITGPNMGGKSTFLRQVALITLMAQMGSFVPASRANLSLVDRIFTRIGATDNLEAGKSTFLVEMLETALICNHATKNSLVILDEVGRGTSTYDGLAIAQAVVEYIYSHIKARCLFATHYHELTSLCETYPGIKPYHAATAVSQQATASDIIGSPANASSSNFKASHKPLNDSRIDNAATSTTITSNTITGTSKALSRVVLLHKIIPGVAEGSFGLEVAALAQLPAPLIARAHEILAQITQQAGRLQVNQSNTHVPLDLASSPITVQGSMLDNTPELKNYSAKDLAKERIIAELAQIDCETLTAKQALDLVWRLRESL